MKSFKLIAIILVAMGLVGCKIDKPSSPKPASKKERSKKSSEGSAKRGKKSKKSGKILEPAEAFGQTVFPLIQENCAGCHSSTAPAFGGKSAEEALTILEDAGKINKKRPEASRIYQRLEEDQHNCWSDCEKDSKKLLKLLKEYLALSGYDSDADIDPMQSEGVEISKSEYRIITAGAEVASPLAVVSVADANATGEWLVGPIQESFSIEAFVGKQMDVVLPAAAPFGLTFTIETTAPDQVLYAKVKGSPADDTTISVDVDASGFTDLILPQGTLYSYVPITAAPVSVGSHTVDIKLLLGEFTVDTIVASSLLPEQLASDLQQVMAWDLGGPCDGKDVKLEMSFLHQGIGSIGFFNPRVTASSAITVESLLPVVNDLADESYATFLKAEIRAVAGTPTAGISGTLIVLADEGLDKDKFSWKVGKCK